MYGKVLAKARAKAVVLLAVFFFIQADADICGDIRCSLVLIGNGKCNPECLTPGCDFDGGDCCDESICPKELRNDGNCDSTCDSVSCGFDGGDCTVDVTNLPNVNALLVTIGLIFLILSLICYTLCEFFQQKYETERRERQAAGKDVVEQNALDLVHDKEIQSPA